MQSVKVKYGNVNYSERVRAIEDELRRVQLEQQGMDVLLAERASRQQMLVRDLDEAEAEYDIDAPENDCSDPVLRSEIARLKALLHGIEALTKVQIKSMKHNGP
jgi:hypothetical protein